MNITRIALFIIFTAFNLQSQNQVDLESQKKQIQNDIKKIELKLSTSKKEKGLIVSNAEDLSYKIKLQENLINTINDQLNIILKNIIENENELTKLKKRELSLKQELSKMILIGYKKKSNINRLMFIFSSSSFQQAFKRIQYFKQYADFQNKSILKIKNISSEIQKVIFTLDSQKKNKTSLIKENEEIQIQLREEYIGLKNLIDQINKNQKKYASEIRKKQKLSDEIDKKIRKLIAEALSKAKKKDGEFLLTEEAKLISKNFNSNKGKLPWPVSKGYIILGFGRQPHPIVKTTTIQSNGVRIRTSKDTEARTIFDGIVFSIILSKNNTYTVLVQHGNFFTAYKNLSEIYISKGDNLKTKDLLGKIATDNSNGQTILSFSIFNNGVPQNPKLWVYKM